jgi:hypothetical protein
MKSNAYLLRGRKEKPRSRYGLAGRNAAAMSFTCGYCHNFVSAEAGLAGVRNRNHCPYCLWSRHLDLQEAGDRLSACKGLMQPLGLTLKLSNKRYGCSRGELMLIHLCMECEGLSINRIAADDDLHKLLLVFEGSIKIESAMHARLQSNCIRLLSEPDNLLVNNQLFGIGSNPTEMVFRDSIFQIMET